MQSERTSLKNQLLKDRYAVEGDDLMLSKKNAVWTWNDCQYVSKTQSLSYFLEDKKSVQENDSYTTITSPQYQFYKHSLKPHHLAVSRVLGPTHSSCCSLQHDCHKTVPWSFQPPVTCLSCPSLIGGKLEWQFNVLVEVQDERNWSTPSL